MHLQQYIEIFHWNCPYFGQSLGSYFTNENNKPTLTMMLSMRSAAVQTARRATVLSARYASPVLPVTSNVNRHGVHQQQHHPFSTDTKPNTNTNTNTTLPRKSLVTAEEGVHQTMKISKSWRNKPLFRRQGDVRFRTGTEASQLLISEANRRDLHLKEFIQVITSTMMCLSPIFERNPKYAFVAKTLMVSACYYCCVAGRHTAVAGRRRVSH